MKYFARHCVASWVFGAATLAFAADGDADIAVSLNNAGESFAVPIANLVATLKSVRAADKVTDKAFCYSTGYAINTLEGFAAQVTMSCGPLAESTMTPKAKAIKAKLQKASSLAKDLQSRIASFCLSGGVARESLTSALDKYIVALE